MVLYFSTCLTACGARDEPRINSAPEFSPECGGLPDESECFEIQPDSPFFVEDCELQLRCDGWPSNPFNSPEQYVQFVRDCNGELRHSVLHIASQSIHCIDSYE